MTVKRSGFIEQIESARAAIPRTLVLTGEEKSASWQYRVSWPCKALSDHGFIADWCHARDVGGLSGLIEAGRYNMVMTPRAHWSTQEESDAWIALVRNYGLAWMYEMDDDGWSEDIVKRQARLFDVEWNKGEQRLEEERQERVRLIRQADGVIVSSHRLAEVARSLTDRPVYFVPNLLDAGWFAERLQGSKRIIPPLTIGWSGGQRDEVDLAIMAEAWTRIAARFPHVRFVVQGLQPRILTGAVPSERLTLLNWISLPDYPRALLNIDIGCCGVAPGVGFNLAKTAIKWYEMTLSGAACVVSDTLYGAEARDGTDALVAETVDEWENQLARLIEDVPLRRKIQRNAKKIVTEKHALDSGWTKWLESFSGGLEYYRTQLTQPELVTNGVLHAA